MLKRFCWFIVLGLLFIHFSVYSDFTPEPAEDKSNRQRLLLNQFKFLSENRFFDTTDSNSIELSNTLYLGAGLELFGQTPIGLNVKTGIEIEYFVDRVLSNRDDRIQWHATLLGDNIEFGYISKVKNLKEANDGISLSNTFEFNNIEDFGVENRDAFRVLKKNNQSNFLVEVSEPQGEANDDSELELLYILNKGHYYAEAYLSNTYFSENIDSTQNRLNSSVVVGFSRGGYSIEASWEERNRNIPDQKSFDTQSLEIAWEPNNANAYMIIEWDDRFSQSTYRIGSSYNYRPGFHIYVEGFFGRNNKMTGEDNDALVVGLSFFDERFVSF